MVTVENPPDTYLNSMIDALRGIWEAVDGLTEAINKANEQRLEEAENATLALQAISEQLEEMVE